MRKQTINPIGTFPFGQSVQAVVQRDTTPKQVFVLGVYASAVHARWVDSAGKTLVNALAVASEPYIFWRGDNADALIRDITIPPELGVLVPAKAEFNGPSGITLDQLILHPLGLDRYNAWLCDLVPHSYANPSQKKALERAYIPLASRYRLAAPSVPDVPKVLAGDSRRREILDAIIESRATLLILLGDMPLRWFLAHFSNPWNKLSDFEVGNKAYGQVHDAVLDGKALQVLPLAHPRQIARLGHSSAVWYDLHQNWIKGTSSQIAKHIKTG